MFKTLFLISFFAKFLIFSPNAMLSKTLRCGNKAYLWKTVFMFLLYGGKKVTFSPSKKMSPESGVKRPAMIFNIVVFPQPDGPKRVTNFPLFIFILKFSKIISWFKDIDISLSSITYSYFFIFNNFQLKNIFLF